MSADLGFAAILSSIYLLSSFFSRQLRSEIAERNSTKTGHMLGSKCDLKTHVRNVGYPLSVQIGGLKTFFRRLRNLTATLTAYTFGTKHDIHNRATTRGLLHHLKMLRTLVHKLLNVGTAFYPPYVNSAFHFIRRWRLANATQPNFAKRRTVNSANNMR